MSGVRECEPGCYYKMLFPWVAALLASIYKPHGFLSQGWADSPFMLRASWGAILLTSKSSSAAAYLPTRHPALDVKL